jgi:hypothetical protein
MSEDDNIKVDEEVVEHLTEVAGTMAKLLDQVMERHDHQTKDMDYFRADLALVRDSIRHIAKVLHEGNGEKPLIARVAILETHFEHLDECRKTMELELREKQKDEDEKENIDKKGKWALRAAIASGFTALGVEVFRLLGI